MIPRNIIAEPLTAGKAAVKAAGHLPPPAPREATSAEAAGEHVGRAERLVRAALENWDARDLERCSDCGRELMSAIREMEAAQSAGFRQPAAAIPEIAERVRRMQREISHLSRLVDAASAFTRGVALLAGEQAPSSARVHEG